MDSKVFSHHLWSSQKDVCWRNQLYQLYYNWWYLLKFKLFSITALKYSFINENISLKDSPPPNSQDKLLAKFSQQIQNFFCAKCNLHIAPHVRRQFGGCLVPVIISWYMELTFCGFDPGHKAGILWSWERIPKKGVQSLQGLSFALLPWDESCVRV